MEKIKTLIAVWILAISALTMMAQTKLPPIWQSSHVQISNTGILTYTPDKDGNTIPDFSRVGYHHGDKSIPVYPAVQTVSPQKGDCHAIIQQAIDNVSALKPNKEGHRGVIQLKRGVYKVSKPLCINASGVALRGEGANVNETCLLATGKERYSLIRIMGLGQPTEIPRTRMKITDDFVPVGAHSFHISQPSVYKVGDRIILYRPATQAWIHDIQMDQIVERQGTRQWSPQEYNLSFEREITKIEGNRIYIDNPVVMQIDQKYGGGEIFKYTFDGRISEVGVSDLCLESEFKDDEDTEHGWIGIQLDNIENGWVRNVTARHFGYAAVSCERFAKNITVEASRCLEPKSIITGGLRYSFNNIGQQNLFMNCQTTEGRHDYVTGAQVCGPNVFYNCTASQTYSDIGPHHRWAVGTLYDNITTDGDIHVQDRGQMGSGHGWAGVTQVLWNCRARRVAVQNPWVSGHNYSIGMKGEKYAGHFKNRPSGIWEGHNEQNIFPRSLYVAQLMARQSCSQSNAKATSEWIHVGQEGRLVYKRSARGDKILDFSHAGYQGGGVALPEVPVKVTVKPLPEGQECSAMIQKAIDQVSAMPQDKKGFRGAVLLGPGHYLCNKSITIATDGVVLRGSGSSTQESTIYMSGNTRYTAIVLEKKPQQVASVADKSDRKAVKITDAYVSAGSESFTVADASTFRVGDQVEIRKPVTKKWIRFMQMHDLERDGKPQTWIKPGTQLTTERQIVAIDGNKITLSVPLVDAYDTTYTDDNTTIALAPAKKRLTQAGIENLRIVSPAQAVGHNSALYYAIRIHGVDCWARRIHCLETMESVRLSGCRITLQEVSIVRKALHQGASRPAEFAPNAGQVLADRCSVIGDNVWFVATGGGQTGPIVFLNCTFLGNGRIEGHQRWSTGILMDNCKVPGGGIDFKNRGSMGSGHGWGSGWSVAWNCEAKNYVNQLPPGTFNWVIGSKGASTPLPRPFNTSGPLLPEGIFDSPNVPVTPQSLYLAQLKERLGEEALKAIGY